MVRYKLSPDLDNRLVECYIKLAKLKAAWNIQKKIHG